MTPFAALTELPPILELALNSYVSSEKDPLLFEVCHSIQKAWFWAKKANGIYMKEILESTMEHGEKEEPQDSLDLAALMLNNYTTISTTELVVSLSYIEKKLVKMVASLEETLEAGSLSPTVARHLEKTTDNLTEALFDTEVLISTLHKNYE